MSELATELQTARRRPVETGKAVVEQIREDDVPFMAGSIAYQAFASLLPILILLFIVVTVVGDQQLAQQVVSATEGVLPDSAQQLLSNAIADENGVGGASASIIGLVTLVWGALKIFRGLDKAFSDIFETEEENSILDQIHDGLVVLAALGVGIIGLVGATSLFAAFGGPLTWVLNLAVLVGGLTLAFLPMYRYFPDADLGWKDALPGALVAAVGWTALQFLFQLYIQVSSKGDSSGVIGAVLLLLLWLYLTGLVLLIAAVVNAVLLGEGDPEPKTGGKSEVVERADDLADQLDHERDRRQTLEYERDRLERELETEREPTPTELSVLRERNSRLRQQLRWAEKPLPVRVVLRVLGLKPDQPDTPQTTVHADGGHDAP